jgi:serralysin
MVDRPGVPNIVGSNYSDNDSFDFADFWSPWHSKIRGTVNDDDIFARGGNDVVEGGNGNDWLHGEDGDDTLYGQQGNDFLEGGWGSDRLYGGIGDDTYYIRDTPDQVFENAGEGTDTVRSQVDYILDANVENLILEPATTYPGSGGSPSLTLAAPIRGRGNSLNNSIDGNEANNILEGFGGNDRLFGGDGRDTLYGDSGDDTLIGGIDNDTIYGGANDDFIWGGAGVDSLFGGSGDDTYMLYEDTSDIITEYTSGGIDKVTSYFSYTLGENLENLELVNTDSAYNGIGNSLNNKITGNRRANYLEGADGNDILQGYEGNDYLIAGNGNDTLVGTYNTSATNSELDTLVGGSGVDYFYLGSNIHGTNIYYRGTGYATINDFTVVRTSTGAYDSSNSDKITLGGSLSDYSVDKTINRSGSLALDTSIFYRGDLIAVLQDTTDFQISRDVVL